MAPTIHFVGIQVIHKGANTSGGPGINFLVLGSGEMVIWGGSWRTAVAAEVVRKV